MQLAAAHLETDIDDMAWPTYLSGEHVSLVTGGGVSQVALGQVTYGDDEDFKNNNK